MNTRRILEGETTPQEGQGFTFGGRKDAMMRTSENRNVTIGPSGWRQRLATANDENHEEYWSGDEEGKRADKDDERQTKQRGTLGENTCGGQQDQLISKTRWAQITHEGDDTRRRMQGPPKRSTDLPDVDSDHKSQRDEREQAGPQ